MTQTRKATTKLELEKVRPEYFRASREAAVVEIGPAMFLTYEGKGAPESPEFQAGIASLYGVAYTLKMLHKSRGVDFKVSALEATWWTDATDDRDFLTVPRDAWHWKLLLMVPDSVDEAAVDRAVAELVVKKGDGRYEGVRLERIEEGTSVQLMHVGPYATEAESIGRMRSFMADQKFLPRGAHHEIYMSDPRRSAPEKLRTIIRQPVYRQSSD